MGAKTDVESSGCLVQRMVGVAQLVERWLVVPEVAGSSPVIHPMYCSVSSRCSSRF